MKKLLGIVVLGLLLSTNSFSADRIELVCTMNEITMNNKTGPVPGGPTDDIVVLDLKNRILEKGIWSGGGIITKISDEKIFAETRPGQFAEKGSERWLVLSRYTGKMSSFYKSSNGEESWRHFICKPGKKLF